MSSVKEKYRKLRESGADLDGFFLLNDKQLLLFTENMLKYF